MVRKTTAASVCLLFLMLVCQLASAANVAIPVTGSGPNGTAFNGTFAPTSFALQNGQIVANGLLTGTLTRGSQALGSIAKTIAMPLANTSTASCDILHLVLGPLDLNLLGLMVHLDQVVLDITAQPGPGNLLGNLLCSLTGLLNNPTDTVLGLLNSVLGILRGL